MAIKVFSDEEKFVEFDQLLNESLFVFMNQQIKGVSSNKLLYTVVELWHEAKRIASRALESKSISSMVDFSIMMFYKSLYDAFGLNESQAPEMLMDDLDSRDQDAVEIKSKLTKCVQAIILYHFYFEKQDELESLNISFDELGALHDALRNGEVVDDYDYIFGYSKTDGKPHLRARPYSPDVVCSRHAQNISTTSTDTIIQDTIASSTDEVIDGYQQLEEEELHPISLEPHHKVRLELLKRLFEKAGVNFKKMRGSQAAAARLVEFITHAQTPIPLHAARNFFCYNKCSKKMHFDEKKSVNKDLVKLGLKDLKFEIDE